MSLPLHELNQHFFAALLPQTHGEPVVESVDENALRHGVNILRMRETDADIPPDAPKPAKPGRKHKVETPAPAYSAEQLEILAAAGINDPAAADPQTVAAILG